MIKDTIASKKHLRNRLVKIKLLHIPSLSAGNEEFNIIQLRVFIRLRIAKWKSCFIANPISNVPSN